MMRKSLALGLAVGSFGLGAWLSPRAMAQSGPNAPVAIQRGQVVHLLPPELATCKVTSTWNDWVQCEGATWRNVHTAAGFRIQTE